MKIADKKARQQIQDLVGDLFLAFDEPTIAAHGKVIYSAGGEPVSSADRSFRAGIDALHISVASANGMDYLLTWNCRHIANATLQKVMRTICEDAGYLLPAICTPLELIEEYEND